MNGNLSPNQFSNKELQEKLDEGGFTVKEGTRQIPETGVFASVRGHEMKTPGLASTGQIGSYRSEKSGELSDPAHYLGGWKEHGHSFLDVTRQFGNRPDAYRFGRKNLQLATFDLGKFKQLGINYGPRMPAQNEMIHGGGGLNLEQLEKARATKSEFFRRAEEFRQAGNLEEAELHEKAGHMQLDALRARAEGRKYGRR